MNRKHLLIILALLSFAASCFGLLWVFSSSSLAMVACNGHFSLSSPEFRCKQPQIAIIVWLGFGALCLGLLFAALRKGTAAGP